MNCLQKRKKHYWLRILVPNKSWLWQNIWVIHRKKKDIDNKKIKKKKKKKYNNTKVFWISRFHKVSDSSLQ